MKRLSKLLVIASALAAGNALATNQNAFFDMQRMITDGYYPSHPSTPPAPAHRETSRTAAADQNAFFDMQRMITDGYYATHPSTPSAPAHRETSPAAHAG